MDRNDVIENNDSDRIVVAEDDGSFHVVLSKYDGPFDLLLDFIKREKIAIEDIFISDITDQYLKAMEQLDMLDLEQASDFIVVAAKLIEIKSRKLLPKLETEESQSDQPDPAKELVQDIEAYKLYREAAEKMREQERINMHYRAPDESVGQPRLVLKDMTTNGLMAALRKMFEKIGERQAVAKIRKIQRDPYTVDEKKAFIRTRLSEIKECTFDELFDEDSNLDEVVTTFSALLDLVNDQEIAVVQNQLFDSIKITKRSVSDDSGN